MKSQHGKDTWVIFRSDIVVKQQQTKIMSKNETDIK
jgi:hypothetical protein